MQFWGKISGEKTGHTNLLEQIGGVQMHFSRQISGKKTGHTQLLEQTGRVQTQFLGDPWAKNGAQ
jgi:hypothetical protein